MTILAKKQGIEEIFVPFENGREASVVEGIRVYPVKDLNSLVMHFNGREEISSLEIGGTKTEDGMHTVFVSAYVSYNDYIKATMKCKA